MRFLILFFVAVGFLRSAFSYAEDINTLPAASYAMGAPEVQKICGIPALEAGLTTDMQRFKAVYKKYEERDGIVNNKKTCGIELAYRALELGKLIFPENSKNLAHLAYNYSVSYREAGVSVNAQAIAYAVSRFEVAFEPNSPEIIPVYEDACIGRINEKEKLEDTYCIKAINLSKKINGRDSIEYVDTILNVSSVLLASSKYNWEDNKDLLLAARNILVKKAENKDLRIARIDFSLGKLQASLGHNQKAVEYFEQALSILDQPQFKTNSLTLTTHAFMVESLEKLGLKDEATKHCLAISQIAPSFEVKDMQPLFRLIPEYPADAARMGLQGVVELEFVVDESGKVINPKIASSTVDNKILETASIETVKKYRYAPRIVGGKPVPVEGVKQTFSYKIAN